MIFERVKKVLLIGLGILLLIIVTIFICLRLAFGPLHDTVTIDLGAEGELVCDEIYNADLADVFYDVQMILKTSNGRRWDLGSVTFHHETWPQQIKPTRVGDWLVIPLEPEKFLQVKILNTLNGKLNDTTLLPFDLREDPLYGESFSDRPNHLYPGTSKLIDISGNTIEASFGYKGPKD